MKNWSITIAVLAHLALPSTSLAQHDLAKIIDEGDRIAKLHMQSVAMFHRLLASPQYEQANFDHLGGALERLSKASREFTVLLRLLTVGNLVTDKRAIPHAVKIIDEQKNYMIKQMREYQEYAEMTSPKARDAEVRRLVLAARDRFKTSIEFVESLPRNQTQPGRL